MKLVKGVKQFGTVVLVVAVVLLVLNPGVVSSAKDKECESKQDGLYPEPNDCRNFYRCAEGERYSFTCGDQAVFNTNVNACDLPWSGSLGSMACRFHNDGTESTIFTTASEIDLMDHLGQRVKNFLASAVSSIGK